MEEKLSTSKGESSFFQKVFTCCLEKYDFESELENEETDRDLSFIGKTKLEFENELSLFPTTLIRPEEKNKIKFTKDDLVEYINNLQNLVYPVISEDNGVKLSKRNYTELNEKIPLIRSGAFVSLGSVTGYAGCAVLCVVSLVLSFRFMSRHTSFIPSILSKLSRK